MDPVLRKQLRDEANAVKDCFTKFSFQALAFSAVMLGAMASYQPRAPLVGLAGLLVIFVVLTVSRIGGYKYSTANRHFAYELYHDTLAREPSLTWEEAQRAWRVVAPALFDRLYVTPPRPADRWTWTRPLQWLVGEWRREQLEREIRTELKKPRNARKGDAEEAVEEPSAIARRFWFDPAEQVYPVAWHPGRYLEEMQRVLHTVAWLSMVPVAAVAVQAYAATDLGALRGPALVGSWSLVIAVAAYIAVRTRQLRARRSILENGMLSIPSSAIVWYATVTACRVAYGNAEGKKDMEMRAIADVAHEIVKAPADVFKLWDWLERKESELAAAAAG